MPATNEQAQAFKGFLESKDQPDFVIRATDYKWHVHSAVISGQSKFFETACYGGFKESHQREISLHEDCPWIVARMIQFFYFGTFCYSHRNIACPNALTYHIHQGACCVSSLSKIMQVGQSRDDHTELQSTDLQRSSRKVAAMVYQIADKYDVVRLRNHAVKELLIQPICDEEAFFEIADIIGFPKLHDEHDLLLHMVSEIVGLDFVRNADRFPRFKTLLGSDANITWLVAEKMQSRYQEMEEAKENKLVDMQTLVDKHVEDRTLLQTEYDAKIQKLTNEIETLKSGAKSDKIRTDLAYSGFSFSRAG